MYSFRTQMEPSATSMHYSRLEARASGLLVATHIGSTVVSEAITPPTLLGGPAIPCGHQVRSHNDREQSAPDPVNYQGSEDTYDGLNSLVEASTTSWEMMMRHVGKAARADLKLAERQRPGHEDTTASGLILTTEIEPPMVFDSYEATAAEQDAMFAITAQVKNFLADSSQEFPRGQYA